MRPLLYLNNTITVPLSLLTDVKLRIKTVDITNISTEKVSKILETDANEMGLMHYSYRKSHRLSLVMTQRAFMNSLYQAI